MKNLSVGLLSVFCLCLCLLFSSCGGDEDSTSKIDPKDSDALSKALKVAGTQKNGSIPVPTFTPTTPVITNSQSSASVTSNNTLFVPFTVNSSNGFSGIYLQVNGAGGYWQIPLSGGSGSGQVVVPVGIPGNVLPGDFLIYYSLYTSGGDVSETVPLYVEIVEQEDADFCELGYDLQTGSDGLTIRSYTFKRSGTVEIGYEMYSLQDRMDVFVNGVWKDGTGSSVASNGTPPASVCGDGADGFVSDTGYLEIPYSSGQRIDVYVSGCFGGTAWDFWIYCPD